MAATAASVATEPSTTTKTTIAVMAAATMARTALVAEAVVALLARPAPISNGRTNTPWPIYGHPWQGHMTVYLGPVPASQQCL
jgi:hypothetical protein